LRYFLPWLSGNLVRAARRAAVAAIATGCLALVLGTPAAAQDNGNVDQAALQAKKEALFQQMLADPANLDVIFAYAEAAAQLGDNEGAVSALQRMLLFNPNLPRVDLELGALYFRMGSFAVARSYFHRALAANPPPEIKARVDQYLAQIAIEESPSRLTGYLLMGGQYQSDANLAPGSATINSPIGQLLLSSQFVKMRDEDVFLTGSALYTYDLGTADRDALEVTGVGFVQRYFRVQRLELDLGEVTAGPRFQFPHLGIPGIESASLKPYAIVNEVGLGQNQYFYTYGNGLEGTATLWPDLAAKMTFEFRHKTFANQPNFPDSTGLDGSDKLVTFALTKPVTPNSALSAEFDFLDQDTAQNFYSNKSYAGLVSYRIRYDDPTGLIGLPWETTISGSRLWSFYGAPNPCCNTSSNPLVFADSDERTRHWSFGVTQVFQVSRDIGIFLHLQRDIVSSNLPLYAYTSNSVLIGPLLRFAAAPGAASDDTADDTASLQAEPEPQVDQTVREPEYRLEAGIGGALGSNNGRATVTSGSQPFDTNDVPLGGNGLAGSVALWADGPLARWSGNSALGNFSFGLEYRHFDNSEAVNVTATIPPSPSTLGGFVTGSVTGDFDSENLMFDAAWRLNSGDVHPFIGIGGGVALIDWSGKLNAPGLPAISASSPASASAGIVSPAAAWHTFVGLDYDIVHNIYVGAGADFYFTDSIAKRFKHTNIQLDTSQLSLLAHAGLRF
jgi:hypothetical protein